MIHKHLTFKNVEFPCHLSGFKRSNACLVSGLWCKQVVVLVKTNTLRDLLKCMCERHALLLQLLHRPL